MRKSHNLGWTEELNDGIVLGLFRWSKDKITLSVTRAFRDRNAVNDRNIIHKWMDRLYWELDSQIDRLKKELTIKTTPAFIRQQSSLGASADPINLYRSSISWSCEIKEKKED